MAVRAGFVGLGNIGRPMAKRLLEAGFETAVFDLAAPPVEDLVGLGARAAATPRDAAEGCDAIGVCVRDDADVLDVCLRADGLLAGARPGAVIAIHSTVLPSTAEQVAAEAAPRGIGVIDACVSGGAAGAEHGALIVMAGGEADALERARPYLDAFARKVVHAGSIGSGCKAKLCNNLLTYLAWTAAFEAHTLAKASGLSQECFEEVTTATGNLTGLMRAFLGAHKLPEETRTSEAMQQTLRGYLAVAEKDLAWTLQLARECGVTLPGTALVSQIMARVYAVDDPRRR
jgi:3-hydroxyisobutyrate dehydrogenase-like beta-hydroxyacid dehydrogenase